MKIEVYQDEQGRTIFSRYTFADGSDASLYADGSIVAPPQVEDASGNVVTSQAIEFSARITGHGEPTADDDRIYSALIRALEQSKTGMMKNSPA